MRPFLKVKTRIIIRAPFDSSSSSLIGTVVLSQYCWPDHGTFFTWPWYCPFLQAPWYSSPSPYWKYLLICNKNIRMKSIPHYNLIINIKTTSWGPAYHLSHFSCRWYTGRCTCPHWATQICNDRENCQATKRLQNKKRKRWKVNSNLPWPSIRFIRICPVYLATCCYAHVQIGQVSISWSLHWKLFRTKWYHHHLIVMISIVRI